MLDDLRERLLREGVKPGVVRRYVAELQDHLDDLGGALPRDEALARLGPPDVLAEAMLAQPGVRSWTARAPWATLALAPLLGLVFGCFFPTLFLFVAVRHFALDLDWAAAVSRILVAFNEHVLPILAGWAAVAIAVRQRAGATWLVAGAALVAVLGGGLIERMDWHVGNFGFGYQIVDPFTTVLGRSFETMLFNLIVILAPYGLMRKRMARTA